MAVMMGPAEGESRSAARVLAVPGAALKISRRRCYQPSGFGSGPIRRPARHVLLTRSDLGTDERARVGSPAVTARPGQGPTDFNFKSTANRLGV